jgi:hypothetical protein
MSDWKRVLGLLLLAILALAFIQYIYGPVSAADNLTINVTPTINATVNVTPSHVHTNVPIQPKIIVTATTAKVVPVMANNTIPKISNAPYYVQQGDTVYVGDVVDISGIMAGVLNFAYYGGYYEGGEKQFLLDTPNHNRDYYKFYIDPEIFGTRLGKWYKWNGFAESHANNLAFVVAGTRLKPNVSENITLQNPNQTPVVIRVPILPDQHVADYLIARGDSISIPAPAQTKAWIFGTENYLYDYKAVNGTLDLKSNILDRLSPGSYTLLLHTRDPNSTDDFTVRYNPETSAIDWFDPVTFAVNHYDVSAQTPENVMNKLKSLIPAAHDTFKLYSLEVQIPSISINQISSGAIPNASSSAATYLEVRGYTNAAPDTVIKVVVDPELNRGLDQIFKEATVTSTEETSPGDMRVFKAIVLVDLYNMRTGVHTLAAKTDKGNNYASANFYIYENWALKPIANKTIRYISGKYGPDEMIPTPTPITVTQIVTKVVTQIVTVPVTPSNEQVYAQQKVASEKTWWEGAWWLAKGITVSLFLIGGMWYGVSVYRRVKE